MSRATLDRGESSVEVIHIAFRAFGIEPFRRFVDSLRTHPAGLPHELVIAFKGFTDLAEAKPWQDVLDQIPHRSVLVPDHGLDIGTYLFLASRSRVDTLCFLNSRSVILADDWLAKLFRALGEQGGGAVGATGSWQGFASDPWRRVYPLRLAGPAAWIERVVRSARMRLFFPPFPNPHLRTNGLMIPRALLLGLRAREPRGKLDAMQFESGWHGLTRQLVHTGLQVAIVDSDGQRHEMGAWATSDTFWQGDQARLLIGDNQTESYRAATAEGRAAFTDYAWIPPRQSATN